MTTDDLTFASVGPAGIHYARCESCQFGQHDGGWHTWAGAEDIDHAAATGQPDPSDKRCGCPCSLQEPVHHDEPDIETEGLAVEPCPVCGEAGACGWDAEGRPLIHSVSDDDGTTP